MKTFSKNAFEFREARICNKGTGVEVVGRLEGPDSMRMEGMGKFVWL
jgi:hypothetical protein